MTTANDLTTVTNRFYDDVIAVSDVIGAVNTTVGVVEQVGRTPGVIAGTLQGIAEPLTFPSVVMTPLKLIPWGVGTAVKKFDQILGYSVDEINEQADRLWDLDESLQGFNNIAEGVSVFMSRTNLVINGVAGIGGYRAVVTQQKTEATKIEGAIGDVQLDGTLLGAKIDARIAELAPWNDTRDGVLSALNAAEGAFANVVDGIADLMPDTSILDNAEAVIQSAFSPISDALYMLDGLLNQTYTVIPRIQITPPIWVPPIVIFGKVITPGYWIPGTYTPAVTVNPGAIIATIGNAIDAVQNFVESLILDALAALGFDFFAAIDALQDKILGPLQPVFDAMDAVESALAGAMAQLGAVADDLELLIGQAEDLFGRVIGFQSLFENTINGDLSADPDDVLVGTEGTDALFGLSGNDSLIGGAGDILFGGEGNDTLEGDGAEMYGGLDDDLITVTGAAGSWASGGEGADTMTGGTGNDTLGGNEGADLILGGKGDDRIDGGADADVMKGGRGSDFFVVDDAADKIVERAGHGGHDTVEASVSYKLAKGAGVEEFRLVGDAVVGVGSNLANIIIGQDGDNTLRGRDGDDTLIGDTGDDKLIGGTGADVFVFDTALGEDNVDRITDFNVGHADEGDKIRLQADVFGDLTVGVLDAAVFAAGKNAQDADDRIVFHQESGKLWFDADGNGAGEKQLFAILGQDAMLTAADIEVF